jgi:hypothetical protein
MNFVMHGICIALRIENRGKEEKRKMRRGKEEKRKMQVVWKMHCGVEWRGNASGEENCIVEWSGGEMQTWRGFALSGGELKWSGVEVEWKWSGSGVEVEGP